jgi:hypothetical protein
MTKSVIILPALSQKTIVYPNHAQNSSCSANGRIPKTVVIVVSKIGCSLDFHASIIATRSSKSRLTFSLILSRKIIASLTTIHANDINQIANGILYGLPVKYNHKLTHKSARIIV